MTDRPTSPLAVPSFRTLFAAQVFSLIAMGLMTVGMSLAAYRIGGAEAAGRLLGFLLAVKMVAYVGIAPLAQALFAGHGRKRTMIGLDLARMVLLLPMAFATQTWHIAVLALAFFAVSAGVTPLFQSVVPDVLPQERTYSRALVWSRVAYTLESVLSPVVAALVLQIMAAEFLFWVAAVAFGGSLCALAITRFPEEAPDQRRRAFLARAVSGLYIYRKTPRLRGLFLMNFALSLSMAWVLVNSVVLAGARLGAAIGAGLVPRLVDQLDERRTMAAGALLHAVFGLGLLVPHVHASYFAIWAVFGLAASLVLTPGGLVIARSARAADRPAVFAAQFSLSHAGWLVAYPMAGELAARIGLEAGLAVLSALTVGTALVAMRVWPATDPLTRDHEHPELAPDHPHLSGTTTHGRRNRHAHPFHIDDLHPNWPTLRQA